MSLSDSLSLFIRYLIDVSLSVDDAGSKVVEIAVVVVVVVVVVIDVEVYVEESLGDSYTILWLIGIDNVWKIYY